MVRFVFKHIFFKGMALCGALIAASQAHAAFIFPNDTTGSVGTDPGTWAASFPLINTNTNGSTVTPASTSTTQLTVRSTYPWTRPIDGAAAASTLTTYQGWDWFDGPIGPNAPNNAVVPNQVDANPQNPNGAAGLSQTTATGFLTGGGNIYSPEAATAFSLVVPNYVVPAGFETQFLVQVRASTGNFDISSFQINGQPISNLARYSVQLLNQTTYPTGFGATAALDYKFEFALPGGSTSNTLTFASAGSGLSFDKLSVDTKVTPIPEPGVIGSVIAFGAASLALLRRKKAKK